MNILFIKHFFIGCMVYEIPRVSVFGHCPYSVTLPYLDVLINSNVEFQVLFFRIELLLYINCICNCIFRFVCFLRFV